jgi:hypothetical protein
MAKKYNLSLKAKNIRKKSKNIRKSKKRKNYGNKRKTMKGGASFFNKSSQRDKNTMSMSEYSLQIMVNVEYIDEVVDSLENLINIYGKSKKIPLSKDDVKEMKQVLNNLLNFKNSSGKKDLSKFNSDGIKYDFSHKFKGDIFKQLKVALKHTIVFLEYQNDKINNYDESVTKNEKIEDKKITINKLKSLHELSEKFQEKLLFTMEQFIDELTKGYNNVYPSNYVPKNPTLNKNKLINNIAEQMNRVKI